MTVDRNPLDVLRERGLLQDVTDEQALRGLLDRERITFYVGFDPTAPSLHAGNLVGIVTMAWLQRSGHRPIVVVGGATGRIGDPSGRDTERELLDDDTIAANLSAFRRQFARFLDLGDEAGFVVDNHDWLSRFGFLDFLRDVGKHFSVNAMIARESVKRRLESREQGISYTEFSYQLLQAYDFAHLYDAYGCRLQGGGSDQWGNIVAGVDLTRRLHDGEVYGYTWPLLTTATGQKFGKSAGNAVWLDPELTSPYAWYQHWINTHDDDVERYLRLLTFLELDRIDAIVTEHREAPYRRSAQRRLAQELTRTVHGEQALTDAERATAILFGDEPFRDLSEGVLEDAFAAAPSVELPRSRLAAGLGLLELMVDLGAASSNGEARRLVSQGGVRVNNVKVDDPTYEVGPDDLATERTLVLRVGKKRYHLARFV